MYHSHDYDYYINDHHLVDEVDDDQLIVVYDLEVDDEEDEGIDDVYLYQHIKLHELLI